jgi:hypothetical protein
LLLHTPVHASPFKAGSVQFQRVVVHTLSGISKNVGCALHAPANTATTTTPSASQRSIALHWAPMNKDVA